MELNKQTIGTNLIKIMILVLFVYFVYYLHLQSLEQVSKSMDKVIQSQHSADSSKRITDSIHFNTLILRDSINEGNTYITQFISNVKINKPKYDSSYSNAISYLKQFAYEKY